MPLAAGDVRGTLCIKLLAEFARQLLPDGNELWQVLQKEDYLHQVEDMNAARVLTPSLQQED